MSTQLNTTVGGVVLKCCVYNASGPRSGTSAALGVISKSEAGAVLSKSATLVKQDGNAMPRFIKDIDLGANNCEGSINSEGLPNQGCSYYLSKECQDKVAANNKPYFVSLSGKSLDENIKMLTMTLEAAAAPGSVIHGIELNLACPNLPGEPIIAYDFVQMDQMLASICDVLIALRSGNANGNGSGKKKLPAFGVKLAPYLDDAQVAHAVRVLARHAQHIQYVTTCNTLGNALFVDTEAECCSIVGKGGFGGLSGGYIKQISLANIRMMYTLMRDASCDIDIVGAGGISSGEDAFQAILCGAKAVQLGTCHWTEGAACFDRVADELRALMKKKGYTSVEDFRGRLKPYEKHESHVPKRRTAVGYVSVPKRNMTADIVIILLVMALAMLASYLLDTDAPAVPTDVLVAAAKAEADTAAAQPAVTSMSFVNAVKNVLARAPGLQNLFH